MSRSLRLAALGLLALAGPARAQIALTAADARAAFGLGAVHRTAAASLAEPQTVDLGTASAAAQTWTFGVDLTNDVEVTTARVVAAAAAPRADRFPGATLALYTDSTYRNGRRERAGTFYTLGAGTRTDFGLAGLLTVPEGEFALVGQYRAPAPTPTALRLGDTYRTREVLVYTETIPAPFFPAVGDTVRYEGTTTVDAFGTVTLADGTRFEALRLVTDYVVRSNTFDPEATPFRTRLVAFVSKGHDRLQFQVDSTWTGGPATVEDYSLVRVLRTATEAPAAPRPAALTFAVPAPNPARGPVALRFTLGAPGPVRLVAYDALGRAVAVVVDGPLGAGAHTATLDASALPPGAYLLRLDAESRTATRTLVRAD